MNNPFEPNDLDLPDGSTAEVERLLQAFRPRTPQLDWDAIAAGSAGTSDVHPKQPRARFSFGQMSLAMAASWLFGAVIGGGAIYWTLSSRGTPMVSTHVSPSSDAPGASTSTKRLPQSSPPEFAQRSAQSTVSQPNQVVNDSVEPSALTGLERVEMSWDLEEPLRVRTQSRNRLVATSGQAASGQATSHSSPPAEPMSDSTSPTPTAKLNRQQLLREYLGNFE